MLNNMIYKTFKLFLFIITFLFFCIYCTKKDTTTSSKKLYNKTNINNPYYHLYLSNCDFNYHIINNFVDRGNYVFLIYTNNDNKDMVFFFPPKFPYTYNTNIHNQNIIVSIFDIKIYNDKKYYFFRFKNSYCYEGKKLDVVYVATKKEGIIGYYFSTLYNNYEYITGPKGKIPIEILDLSDKKIVQLL